MLHNVSYEGKHGQNRAPENARIENKKLYIFEAWEMLCFHITTRGRNMTELNIHHFYSLIKCSPENVVNRSMFQCTATGTVGIRKTHLHLNSATEWWWHFPKAKDA